MATIISQSGRSELGVVAVTPTKPGNPYSLSLLARSGILFPFPPSLSIYLCLWVQKTLNALVSNWDDQLLLESALTSSGASEWGGLTYVAYGAAA